MRLRRVLAIGHLRCDVGDAGIFQGRGKIVSWVPEVLVRCHFSTHLVSRSPVDSAT